MPWIWANKASGSWLLFADADVHMAPGALRRAMAYAAEHSIDHLAAVPDLWPSSLPVDAAVALFCRTFMVAMRLWAVPDPKSDAAIGVGAFNLVRREAFRRSAGFSWLRMEVGDDLGLGMMLKQSGARCCLVNAHSLLGLHWYRSLREMAHGAEKAYASAARCSLAPMSLLAIVLVLMEWAPLVVLACGAGFPIIGQIPGLLWSGVAMLAAAIGSSVILARWSRSRLLPALLFPLAALLAGGILLRSGWLGYRRGGILWRRNALSQGSIDCRPAIADSVNVLITLRRDDFPSRRSVMSTACPASPHKLESRLKHESSHHPPRNDHPWNERSSC